MGPTAAGKTDLALSLCEHLPCEIISVDSALVYRGMDIGTAKPSPEILDRVPHHLINIIEPTEAYSAARFREDALKCMAQITAKGKIPLLAGGTMLYFRALERGLSDLPASEPELRARLEADMVQEGSVVMHQRLQEIDPDAAARIHPNDPQRIQRALEVYQITGQTMTQLQALDKGQALPYRWVKLILAPQDRSELHRRIELRFHQMIESGLVEEVRSLRDRRDLSIDLPSMRAVGYRQVWEFLEGHASYDGMIHNGIVATRGFAKRQMTWLRAEKDAMWLDSMAPNLVHISLNIIDKSLNTDST
jgi:tRNA dimethylallyltransferase